MATIWMKAHVNLARLQYQDVLNVDHMTSALNARVSTLLLRMDSVFAEKEVRINTPTRLRVLACAKKAIT